MDPRYPRMVAFPVGILNVDSDPQHIVKAILPTPLFNGKMYNAWSDLHLCVYVRVHPSLFGLFISRNVKKVELKLWKS